MPQQPGRGLSLADWLVLCVISEGPTHGFAIACLLAPDGSLGEVWHVTKPVIYRAAQRLEHLGLITVSEKQSSRRGPALAQLQATAAGRQAAGRWLHEPADHPRDIRSELLVKLALLDRVGVDSRDLLRAQRGQLAPVAAALAGQVRTATGYDRVLAVWRRHRQRPPLGAARRCPHHEPQPGDQHTAAHGGGIFNNGGTVTLSATPVTGNSPDNCEPSGTIAGCTG